MSQPSHARRILLRVTVVIAIILIVCTFLSRSIANSLLVEVTVANAIQGTLDTDLQMNGIVEYSELVELCSPVSAPILEIYVMPGEKVSKGDALFQLDLRTYQLEYDRMQLSLDQLRENQTNYGLTQTQKEYLDRQIELAERELLLYAETYLVDDIVCASEAGTIKEVRCSKGQDVAKGNVIAVFIPADAIFQLTLPLPADLAQSYLPGDHAVIRYQDTESGSIEQLTAASNISEKIFDGSSGSYMLIVPADIPILHEGQGVSVQLKKTSEYYGALVPRAAIQYDAATGLPYVYATMEREGLFGTETFVHRLDVTILNENEIYVAIDNFNLAENVVISTTQPIQSGQKVKVMGS